MVAVVIRHDRSGQFAWTLARRTLRESLPMAWFNPLDWYYGAVNAIKSYQATNAKPYTTIMPQAVAPEDDTIRSDATALPYRADDLDDFGCETETMRNAYLRLFREEPSLKSAVEGKAESIASLDVMVEPANDKMPEDVRAAKFVEWAIENSEHGWDGLFLNVLKPAFLLGWSCQEIVVRHVDRDESAEWGGMVGLKHCRSLNTNKLRLKLDAYRNVMGVVNTVRGLATYARRKVLLFTHNELFHNPFGSGDAATAYKDANVIDTAMRLWGFAIKVYGGPFLKGKYSAKDRRKQLEAALDAARQGGWISMPKEDDVEVINLATATSFSAFQEKIKKHEERVYTAVRGAYLPFVQGNSQGGESRGSAETSKGTSSDPKEFLIGMSACRVITRDVVPHLVKPNFPPGTGMPKVRLGGVNWSETLTQLNVAKGLKDLGHDVEEEYLTKVTGMPIKAKPAVGPGAALPNRGGQGGANGPGDLAGGGPNEPSSGDQGNRYLVTKTGFDKNGHQYTRMVRGSNRADDAEGGSGISGTGQAIVPGSGGSLPPAAPAGSGSVPNPAPQTAATPGEVNAPFGQPATAASAFTPKRSDGTPINPDPQQVYSVPPKSIISDPDRFQYKVSGVGDDGVTNQFKGQTAFDPQRAGPLLVWRDSADQRDYVVDGHHRHELATRTNAPSMFVRYTTASTAEDAKTQGAAANIAKGNGTKADTRAFLKSAQDNDTTPPELLFAMLSLAERGDHDGVDALAALADDPDSLNDLLASGDDDTDGGTIRTFAEGGFTGTIRDSIGRVRHYVNGKQVKKADAQVGEGKPHSLAPISQQAAGEFVRKALFGQDKLPLAHVKEVANHLKLMTKPQIMKLKAELKANGHALAGGKLKSDHIAALMAYAQTHKQESAGDRSARETPSATVPPPPPPAISQPPVPSSSHTVPPPPPPQQTSGGNGPTSTIGETKPSADAPKPQGARERRVADIRSRAEAIPVTDFMWDDRSVPPPQGEWFKATGRSRMYAFQTRGGQAYKAEMSDSGKLDDGTKSSYFLFSDQHGSFDVTGAGGAHEVFSTVTAATAAAVKKLDLKAVSFSAAEPSRVRLYDRLVQSLGATVPGYRAIAVDKEGGGRLYMLVKNEHFEAGKRNLERSPFADDGGVKELHVQMADDVHQTGKVFELPTQIEEEWFTPEGWPDDATTKPNS